MKGADVYEVACISLEKEKEECTCISGNTDVSVKGEVATILLQSQLSPK